LTSRFALMNRKGRGKSCGAFDTIGTRTRNGDQFKIHLRVVSKLAEEFPQICFDCQGARAFLACDSSPFPLIRTLGAGPGGSAAAGGDAGGGSPGAAPPSCGAVRPFQHGRRGPPPRHRPRSRPPWEPPPPWKESLRPTSKEFQRPARMRKKVVCM